MADKVRLDLDVHTAHKLEALLREGLVSHGPCVGVVTPPPPPGWVGKVPLEIDLQTAAKLDKELRERLVASGAISDEDNKKIQAEMNKIK